MLAARKGAASTMSFSGAYLFMHICTPDIHNSFRLTLVYYSDGSLT